jgi:ParB-like chromosome segregation protein Spo0J
MQVKWINDSYAEQTIKKFGISYKIEDVSMSSINWEESRKNGARYSYNIDTEHVTALALAMANGDSLPRPVVRKIGGKYIIFGGNHRVPAAKELGELDFSAYVIETTDEAVIFALPAALNAQSGQQSREERTKLAVASVYKGLAPLEASNRFSIPVANITNQIRADDFRKELQKLNIPPEKLTTTSVLAIAAIKNPNVYAPAARLVLRGKLSSEECKKFSQDIRKEKTEAQQIAIVGQYEKTLGLNGTDRTAPIIVTSKRSASTAIKIAVGTLEKNLGVRTVNQWGITEKGEKIDFIARIRKLCAGLESICKRG